MTARGRKAVTITIAAILGATIGFAPARRVYREAMLRRDLARLIDVATRRSNTASRLRIATAPHYVAMRSAIVDSNGLELHAAAGAVLSHTTRIEGDDALRATAIAHYYTGDYRRAVQELERIANASPSASAWNDLAAARLELSKTTVLEILPALVAVEKALAADQISTAALYNRAAILERMGLRGHARAAWELALVAEGDPEWRENIHKRMRGVASEVDQTHALRIIAALLPDDTDGIRTAVERFPQEARRYTENALLAEWATAARKGDAPAADMKLRLARNLAAELQRRSGETLASDVVATIDAAAARGQETTIVSVYSIYAEGRALLAARNFATAEIRLEEAATFFARASCPMANVARYNATTAVLEQNRVEEGAARYVALLQNERSMPGHRGLMAQLAWQIARAEGLRGHWAAALGSAQAAVDGFRSLGEKTNTGFMENMLAEIYDYLGQPERAWTHRVIAFDRLSAANNASLLQASLGGAARERVRSKDWPAAIALLDLEVVQSRTANQPLLLADALARRARARSASGDPQARDDIAFARTTALRVTDPQERAQADAAVDTAEGIAERDRDPKSSIRLFTGAIQFCERTSRILLPELYLERGRAHLARGSHVDAFDDFSRGIDRLEEQRATLSNFDLRSTVADIGQDLYLEAVRVAARRGDAEQAYQIFERSRGRALMKRIASDDVPPPARVQKGTRVVEFMVLPEKLIVFTIDRELRMKEIDLQHAQLEQVIDTFETTIGGETSAVETRNALAALYDALLRPLDAVTAGVSTVAFVPSGILERVPWAALYDRERKRYVVEDVTVLSAPSATLHVLMTATTNARGHRALIVANPQFDATFVELPPLPGAEKEARAVARNYPERSMLVGAVATIARFRREVEASNVLHFAGHAISSEISDDQSFLLLAFDAATGDSGVLYSRDIAALPLRNVSPGGPRRVRDDPRPNRAYRWHAVDRTIVSGRRRARCCRNAMGRRGRPLCRAVHKYSSRSGGRHFACPGTAQCAIACHSQQRCERGRSENVGKSDNSGRSRSAAKLIGRPPHLWHEQCSSISPLRPHGCTRFWRKAHEHHRMDFVWSGRRRDRQVPDARTRPGWLDRNDPARHRWLICWRLPGDDSDGSAGADRGMDRVDHRRDRPAVHLSSHRRPARSRLTDFLSPGNRLARASRVARPFFRFMIRNRTPSEHFNARDV
jgi:CHAT domain-containing protein